VVLCKCVFVVVALRRCVFVVVMGYHVQSVQYAGVRWGAGGGGVSCVYCLCSGGPLEGEGGRGANEGGGACIASSCVHKGWFFLQQWPG
jgi:hypothetical protein